MNKWEKIKAKFPGLAAFIDSIMPDEKVVAASADDAGAEGAKVKTPAADEGLDDGGAGANAAFANIKAELESRMAYCSQQLEEMAEVVKGLQMAIEKLSGAAAPAATNTETPATDAAPDHDTISRAEILSPGVVASSDMAAVALKGFYATTDGKAIVDTLTGGEAPAFDDAKLFVAVSEIVKAKRTAGLAGTIAAADAQPVGNWHDEYQKAVNVKWAA